MKNKIKPLVFYLLIIGWTLLMFGFSGQTAEESSRLSGRLTQYLIDRFSIESISFDMLEHILRKTAHFCMFALEGFLMYMSIYLSFRIRRRAVVLSAAVSVAIASLNELHQLFFEGRSCELRDILINSSGAFTGIAAAVLAYHCYLLIKSRLRA